MKARIITWTAVIATATLVVTGTSNSQTKTDNAGHQFARVEHAVVTGSVEDIRTELEKRGKEGWKVSAATQVHSGYTVFLERPDVR